MMDFAWLSEVADLFLPGAAEASRGLDPAIFQTVVRGSVLVLNLGGWAMLRAIERLYEQPTVRAILDAVLWQSLGAFTIVGAELAVISPRFSWMQLPSLLLSWLCWTMGLIAMVGVVEAMTLNRFRTWRPRILLVAGLVLLATLPYTFGGPWVAASPMSVASMMLALKVLAQLVAAGMVWYAVPANHPRRRLMWILVVLLVSTAAMRSLSERQWDTFDGPGAPRLAVENIYSQMSLLFTVLAVNGAVVGAVVGICLRLSYDDLAEEHARITLVERIAAGRRADADAGQFAVTVAHDLKNVLQATTFVATELRRTERGREQYAALAETSDRLARKLSRLLEFARTDPAAPSLVELGQFVERMRPIFDTLFVERLLTLVPSDVGLLVRADEEALERMVVELCEQARDGTPPRGTVNVQLSRQEVVTVSATEEFSRPRVAVGSYACLAVIDAGAPFSADELSTLAAPRAEEVVGARGGLGLAWVRAHARSIGGDLTVDRDRPTGAAVRLWLPLVKG